MPKQNIERELSADFVNNHGGLINGMPPAIHEDAYMADSYEILSCEPIVGKYAYKIVYAIENKEDKSDA